MAIEARTIAVVLLEDDDLDAELIVEQLRAGGLAVAVRRSASEAEFITELSRPGVDVVLSDFALPGYGGLAALDATNELLPDVPFIFVSGAIGEERAIETLQRGATDYVLKSRLERLPVAVLRALALATERKRRREAEAERDRLFESERLARASAESANRMKDEFLAVASHELRTPLNAILGWTTLLSNAGPNPELFTKGITVIKRNALAQSRLIEDILDISRIVTGKLQLSVSRASISSFVQPALEAIRPAAKAKGITLEVDLDEVDDIEADAERLQQVIWNLLSNAVKFTPSNGRVHVSAEQHDTTVTIAVQDSGIGIAPEFLPYVFERFRQADPTATRRAGGLGLGLAIVLSLIEAHGGNVAAESPGSGSGARFVIRLPRRADATGALGVAPRREVLGEDAVESARPNALRGVHVLVVEDDADSRDLIALILRASGAEVSVAASALEGLTTFEARPADIIVSDIGMPKMDGYTFIRRVRELESRAGGQTPAVALTAYTRELDQTAAVAAGFQWHLAKPVSAGALVRTLREVVATSRSRLQDRER